MFYHNIKEDLRSPRKIPPASRFRFSLIFTMSLLTCFLGFTWQTKYDINCGLASNNGNEHPEHLKWWQKAPQLLISCFCISFVDTLGCTKYVDWYVRLRLFCIQFDQPYFIEHVKKMYVGEKNMALLGNPKSKPSMLCWHKFGQENSFCSTTVFRAYKQISQWAVFKCSLSAFIINSKEFSK